jgi:hypothetical protein
MPPKKQEIQPKIRVEIVVAVIGVVGTVLVALIALLPNTNIFKSKPLATATPTVFIKYDDPLGVFSVEIPSNFIVSSREKSNDGMTVVFAPVELKDMDKITMPLSQYGVLTVMVFRSTVNPTDVQGFNKFMNDYLIEKFQKIFESKGKLITITNTKTNKGYLMSFKLIPTESNAPKETVYTLVENDQTAVLMMGFFVLDESLPSYQISIDHVFSNYSWSPSDIINYFSLPK